MVEKVNGGIKPGVWVEQEVRFVKVEFADDVSTSGFAIPNSVVEKALKLVAGRATILGVSELAADGLSLDVMLGYAQGHFAAANDGVIVDAVAITGLDDAGVELTTDVTVTFAKFAGLPKVVAADLREFPAGEFRPVFDYGL